MAVHLEVVITFCEIRRKILDRRGAGGDVLWDIAARGRLGRGVGPRRAGEDRGKDGGNEEDCFEHFSQMKCFCAREDIC